MARNDIHLEPGCPWYPVSEMRLPNVKWCEANLCSWIVNPADTWSNLSYIILGFWLMRAVVPKNVSREKFWLGLSIIVMGACSFIHHAAYTFVFQILDFLGMYWFLLFAFAANLVRLGKLKSEKFFPVWVSSMLGLTAFTVLCDFLDIKIQAIVLVIAVILFIQEITIFKSKDAAVSAYKTPNLKILAVAAVFMIIAATCSALDIKGIWCDPDNHWLQGHAAWHLFSSIGVFLYSKHLLNSKPFLVQK